MKLYNVKMQISFTKDYEVFAEDEDKAYDWAYKEAHLDIHQDAYHVGVDCEEITEEIDEGYIDEDRWY